MNDQTIKTDLENQAPFTIQPAVPTTLPKQVDGKDSAQDNKEAKDKAYVPANLDNFN